MSLSSTPERLSTRSPRTWPVAAIVIVVALRAPANILLAALAALAGIVALMLSGRLPNAYRGTVPPRPSSGVAGARRKGAASIW